MVGLDEAGRGPLAGPVVAGAVCVKLKVKSQKLKVLESVNDSKKLSEKKREELYEILINHSAIIWGVGIISEKVIDKINILEATKLAMEKAVDDLNMKPQSGNNVRLPRRRAPQGAPPRNDGRVADFLLIDGNFKINSQIPQKSIVKGDQKVFSIAAASIIAKVTRDRLMQKMHKKYPAYGFDQHKGYGTALHVANLKSFGSCKIHRKTFWPVSSYSQSAFVDQI